MSVARSLRHRTTLVFLAVAFFLLAVPALAQEDGSTTTTAPAANLTPAVPIETPTDTAATLDWTYRFLIPTGLVLAGLVILITSIRYFTNVVRKRYRIIEE